MACWIGKAVGGTLGMPVEGQPGPLDLDFYDPIPTEMLPNDDLDLQVVWAVTLHNMAHPHVHKNTLAQAWKAHVQFPWDEYGVALRNLHNNIPPPLSGNFDNWFTDSMGAPIRSEIWACLAPGNPQRAAAYAYEDACVDHGGEGVWAEMFLAALQSAAFTQSDPQTLLHTALSLIPESSRTRRAVEDTVQWWQQGQDWQQVRAQVLEKHGRDNFTDAPMNIAFTVLGWLAGGGDFSSSICIAVNCGMDTDCTGATVGALLGILDPGCIPDRWVEPIGHSLVLSPDIVGLSAPDSLEGFTDLVVGLRERLAEGLEAASAEDASVDGGLLSGLEVGVERCFVEAMPGVDVAPVLDGESVTLEGTVGSLGGGEFGGAVMLLEYRFVLLEGRAVRVMLNTREACRVWVDGVYGFGRAAGGVMAPSFHRVPADQSVDLELGAGKHRLVAALARPAGSDVAEWVVGVGDKATMQWSKEGFCGPQTQ